MSQLNDSFPPNAESTRIINNSSLNSESCSDECKQIIKELSLEDIDFEEPLTPKENKNDSSEYSQNSEVKKNDNIDEYKIKLQNIGKIIYLDNGNVTNFNTENISISQWSRGDVVLNGKPLKV